LEEVAQLDVNVNVNWPLSHYKSAVRYLHREPEEIKATGGTNWQKYLPPRFQRRIFYPSLWSVDELENWGKGLGGEGYKRIVVICSLSNYSALRIGR
jgi:tryptophan 2,3-dioxygenase